MHLKYRNVNEAFRDLVEMFCNRTFSRVGGPDTVATSSRNGPVLYIQEPVTITYTHPRERVLFNEARDANPFFHLYESLWMLVGRNDVAPLQYYVSTIDQFSDDGVTFNGAYGWRWRHSRPGDGRYTMSNMTDQLKLIIEHLKAKPNSRRAVLHMSNVEDDLLKMDTTKDQCCNLVVTFLIREEGHCGYCYDGEPSERNPHDPDSAGCKTKHLDMTVFNRSNDMIWGMLGANVVHFSMLQEYMAACIGVEVGHYHQITNNLHVYEWNFKPEEWLDPTDDFDYRTAEFGEYLVTSNWKPFPLVQDPATFDREVVEFVERHSEDALTANYKEPFLQKVAQPVCGAYHHYKRKNYGFALLVADTIASDDWRIACVNWLKRRMEKRHAKASD